MCQQTDESAACDAVGGSGRRLSRYLNHHRSPSFRTTDAGDTIVDWMRVTCQSATFLGDNRQIYFLNAAGNRAPTVCCSVFSM